MIEWDSELRVCVCACAAYCFNSNSSQTLFKVRTHRRYNGRRSPLWLMSIQWFVSTTATHNNRTRRNIKRPRQKCLVAWHPSYNQRVSMPNILRLVLYLKHEYDPFSYFAFRRSSAAASSSSLLYREEETVCGRARLSNEENIILK